jgi:two-component system, OmpR family, alkaline phosphatase synthesis response regulator PhoP
MNEGILLVEDEPNIAAGLVYNLEEEGYRVIHVLSGEQALELLRHNGFALIILDLSLPGINGLDVCRSVREEDPRLPILILTARADERDRVEGLAAGADDYLTKPFNLEEFLLRVRGMLRRSEWYRPASSVDNQQNFGDIRLDLREQRAATPRGEVLLTELEVRMLRIFMQREGEVVTRAELLESVWGISPETETRTLDNFILRLRKYFEPDPARPIHFLTVRGRGYRFVRNGTSKDPINSADQDIN